MDDDDLDVWSTATRETQEEIGIERDQMVPLGLMQPTYAHVSDFWVLPCVAWLKQSPVRFAPNPTEVARIIDIPLDLLLLEANWRPLENWPGMRGFRFRDATIWGLTERILSQWLQLWRQAAGGSIA